MDSLVEGEGFLYARYVKKSEMNSILPTTVPVGRKCILPTGKEQHFFLALDVRLRFFVIQKKKFVNIDCTRYSCHWTGFC